MLHVLKQDPSIEIGGLLTTMNEQFDRVAMHAVRRRLVEAQASAAGVPLRTVPLPWPCTNEEYETRMRAAVAQAVEEGFTHVAFGDLFLEDVRKYREQKLAGTGLTPLFPIWGIPTDRLAAEMVDERASVGAHLRQPEAPGSIICRPPIRSRAARRSSRRRRKCGERGEFHSFAYDGPMFNRPIADHSRRHRRSRWVRVRGCILNASSVSPKKRPKRYTCSAKVIASSGFPDTR